MEYLNYLYLVAGALFLVIGAYYHINPDKAKKGFYKYTSESTDEFLKYYGVNQALIGLSMILLGLCSLGIISEDFKIPSNAALFFSFVWYLIRYVKILKKK